MTITIYESIKPTMVIIECKRKEFVDKFGKCELPVDNFMLAHRMKEISAWVNNELKEECLFEIG